MTRNILSRAAMMLLMCVLTTASAWAETVLYGVPGQTLNLTFTPAGAVTAIEAGTPYIIKWAEADNLVNPVFTGVTISNTNNDFTSADGKVTFKGTYAYQAFDTENTSILFVGGDNLYWPEPTGGNIPSIGAFRAYFELSDGATASEFRLNFEDYNTGVESIHNSQCLMHNEAGAWFTLDGRKLSGMPSTKGIYVNNGRKVFLK